jgi:hypothetical protein
MHIWPTDRDYGRVILHFISRGVTTVETPSHSSTPTRNKWWTTGHYCVRLTIANTTQLSPSRGAANLSAVQDFQTRNSIALFERGFHRYFRKIHFILSFLRIKWSIQRLRGWGIGVRALVEARFFFHIVQTGYEAHPASYVTRTGVKGAGIWSCRLPF